MAEKPETFPSQQFGKALESEETSSSDEGTDVILACGGQTFTVNKMVLSSDSNYFRKTFTPEWEKSGRKVIELPSIGANEMEIILSFLCTGKINEVDDPSLLKSLIKTSHFLEMKVFFRYCCNRFCSGLSCANFLDILSLAMYTDEGMSMHVRNFLAHHFSVVAQNAEFQKLNAIQMKKIIQHRNICNSITDNTVKALLQWANIDEDRQETVAQILFTVDLQCLSSIFLMELLREETTLQLDFDIITLLKNELTARVEPPCHNSPVLLCFGRRDRVQVCRTFDVTKNQWSEVKILPFNYNKGMSIVWYHDYVYFIGGRESNSLSSSVVIKYDPSDNKLISAGKLLIPTFQAGSEVFNKSIYVLNGRDENDHASTAVQCYNPVTGCCEVLANTNCGHDLPSVFSYSNHLYVLGSDKGENAVEQYNPDFDEWTVITAVPGDIVWCSMAILDDKLFVVPTFKTNEFQVYDFTSDKWVKKTIKGSPNNIFGLFPINLKEKSTLLVLDDQVALHYYDVKVGNWVGISESNKEPWDPWQTCITYKL